MAFEQALLIVDVQNDFCEGGALPVAEGSRVVPKLNEYIELFTRQGLPILASRDWHPRETRHFLPYGGKWPPHCIQDTPGAQFHPGLKLPPATIVISKGLNPDQDAYSAFQAGSDDGRPLRDILRRLGVEELFVGGLATDVCVKHTVLDALGLGFRANLLMDAVRGVDLVPGDVEQAIATMMHEGARAMHIAEVRKLVPAGKQTQSHSA